MHNQRICEAVNKNRRCSYLLFICIKNIPHLSRLKTYNSSIYFCLYSTYELFLNPDILLDSDSNFSFETDHYIFLLLQTPSLTPPKKCVASVKIEKKTKTKKNKYVSKLSSPLQNEKLEPLNFSQKHYIKNVS